MTNTVQLIEKFGDKGEEVIKHFWPALVQQQFVSGWVGIGIFIALAIVTTVVLRLGCRAFKRDEENVAVGCFVGGGVLAFVLLLTLALGGNGAITQVINPEAAAFKELVRQLR